MATCNLTNDAMSGVNKELYVNLTKEEIRSFFYQFITGIWKMSRHELKKGRLQELEEKKYMPRGEVPPVTHPSTMVGINTLHEAIKDLIQAAEKSIVISAWTFTDEVDIPKLLLESINRGVKVTVYSRPNYLNGAVLKELRESGAKVYANERFHAKTVVVDGKRSIVTTANFAKHGIDDGFETGIFLGSEDSKRLSAILSQWDKECDWELSLSSSIENLSGIIRIVDSEKREIREIKIEDEREILHSDIRLKEIKRNEELILPTRSSEPQGDTIYKRVRHQYTIVQPVLPNGALKKYDINGKFSVFELSSSKELFLPISTWDELDEAREIAKSHKSKVVRFTEKKDKEE